MKIIKEITDFTCDTCDKEIKNQIYSDIIIDEKIKKCICDNLDDDLEKKIPSFLIKKDSSIIRDIENEDIIKYFE